MVDLTVIIPQRDSLAAVSGQLPALRNALEKLSPAFEIVVVDDGSTRDTAERREALLDGESDLRFVELDRPQGISAALTAGLLVARGRTIVVIEAGDVYPPEQVERLLNGLQRADIVFGRQPRSGFAKFRRRVARIPRWLMLGLEVREPDATFWAARAEALAGMELARGMYRYLSTLVAMRGYRVNEILVETNGSSRPLRDAWPNPGDLLCVWWLKKRWRTLRFTEVGQVDPTRAIFPVHWPATADDADEADSDRRSA